jgi:hypothetical protein
LDARRGMMVGRIIKKGRKEIKWEKDKGTEERGVGTL